MTGQIPKQTIQDIVSRNDIVAVINARVPLTQKGIDNFVACCPFHQEDTPSFSVSRVKGVYYCFGCHERGNVVQFLQSYENIGFIDAMQVLADNLGVNLPAHSKHASQQVAKDLAVTTAIYQALAQSAQYFSKQLRQHRGSERAIAYLKSRGITGHTAKKFGLGFAPPGWRNLLSFLKGASSNISQADGGISNASSDINLDAWVQAGMLINKQNSYYDRFQDRIMFPIRNPSGQIIGFGGRIIDKGEPKYLNSPQTEVFNKRQELYGLYEVLQYKHQCRKKLSNIIVVEGYTDVIALSQAGINNSVATLGTACSLQHIEGLFKHTAEIIFCFDADAAGQQAAWRALELSLPLINENRRLKFLNLPAGTDPDSYVREYGADGLKQQVDKAVSLPDFMLNILAKDLDLSQIDMRVQFIEKAKGLINKLQAGLFKDIMFNRLGLMVSLDPKLLTESPAKLSPVKSVKKVAPKVNLPLLSPAIRALALLLSQRGLITVMPDITGLENLDTMGSGLFCAVAKIILHQHDIAVEQISKELPAKLASYFSPYELIGIAKLVPAAGVKQEFLGAIKLMQRRKRQQIIDSFLDKARAGQLSMADKQHLQRMLMEEDS